jgi:hypothetical protein
MKLFSLKEESSWLKKLKNIIRVYDMPTKLNRNPFVALCKYASQNNWCWKLVCTTCMHQNFRISFSKIIRGLHPDKDEFWTSDDGGKNSFAKEDLNKYNDFLRNANLDNQKKLAEIVSKAKIADIQSVAKFPDWLGYIGLALEHCDSGLVVYSKKIISDSFLPQFVLLLKNKGKISESDYLQKQYEDSEIISLSDLETIESLLEY